MSDVNLSVNLGGLVMANPVTVASGTFAPGRTYTDFDPPYDFSRLGAIVTKGVSLEPWEGNPAPRIAETPSGMLNCIGLENPGVEGFLDGYYKFMSTQDTPLIVNVAGHSVDEYPRVIERLESACGIEAYEINISCPNIEKKGASFSEDPHTAADVVRRCRAVTDRPLFAKLTPNVTHIGEVARAVEDAGADAVSLINTVIGMAVDAYQRRPLLSHIVGGLSGPAIKPIALAKIWECYHAVDVPLVGMGGITCAQDAVEFMLVGATAVAVGTATFVDPSCAFELPDAIAAFCEKQGIDDVNELVGALET